MTMKRNEKATHTAVLSEVCKFTSQVAVNFESPREIAKRGGRTRMTATEYKELRMPGRRSAPASEKRERQATEQRGARKIVRK